MYSFLLLNMSWDILLAEFGSSKPRLSADGVNRESKVEPIEQPKQDDLSRLVSLLEQAHQSLAQHWLGDDFVIELLLASIIARGHVLVVDVPGVGKTTLAKGLAQILGLDFNRIQFTNDILPADILGGSIYNASEAKFTFSPGRLFASR